MNKVIITGGSSGIGKATALLLENSYQVFVLDTNKPDFKCTYFKVDITDGKSLEKVFTEIGPIDALVHSAGVYMSDELVDMEDEGIASQITINLTGTALVNKYALKNMKDESVIINISSGLGIVPEPASPIYSATKAGTIMLTKALAQRYASRHIRVNAVLPGPIDTPLLRNAFSSTKEYEEYKKVNPMRRTGKPEEVAKLVEYLLSNDASFITGGCIPIDGGESSSSLYSPAAGK